MITEKLFNCDAYETAFAAEVLECVENAAGYGIVLNKTLFYPEGGGQPADTGTLVFDSEIYNVTDVKETGGKIVHTVNAALPTGASVTGKIDWERRFSLMQQHTGEHIVSGIIKNKYKYDNVGFHIGTGDVTIDFNGVLAEDDLIYIEEQANKAVYENIRITTDYPPPDILAGLNYRSKISLTDGIRIVTVPGYDTCACCGTHCKATGEVGIIKILGSIKYKNGVRISLLCGVRALRDYASKNNQIYSISGLLSAKPEDVYSAVARLKNENGLLSKTLSESKNELYKLKCESVPEGSPHAVMFENGASNDDLRRFCLLLSERAATSAVFSENGDGTYKYAIGSLTRDVRALSKELCGRFGGKGGGQPALVSGTLDRSATRAALEDFIKCQN